MKRFLLIALCSALLIGCGSSDESDADGKTPEVTSNNWNEGNWNEINWQ